MGKTFTAAVIEALNLNSFLREKLFQTSVELLSQNPILMKAFEAGIMSCVDFAHEQITEDRKASIKKIEIYRASSESEIRDKKSLINLYLKD